MGWFERSTSVVSLRSFFSSLLLFLLLSTYYGPQLSYALQWDRQLPVPAGLTQHSATSVKLSGIQIFLQNVATGLHDQDANYTLNGNVIIYFGGIRTKNDINRDIWMTLWPVSLNRGGSIQWARPPQYNARPLARYDHNAISLDGMMDASMFIFGGRGESTLASMWYYEVSTNTWIPLGPGCPNSYSRSGASPSTIEMCYTTRNAAKQVDPRGCPWPSARAAASMTRVNDTIYLFGGAQRKTTLASDTLGELWSIKIVVQDWYDLIAIQRQSGSNVYLWPESWQHMKDCPIAWQQLTVGDGSAKLRGQTGSQRFPQNRFSHAATDWQCPSDSTRRCLYIMGGAQTMDPNSQLGDVWVYDPEEITWTEITPVMAIEGWPIMPSFRTYAHILGVDVGAPAGFSAGGILLAGGSALGSTATNILWILLPPYSNSSTVQPNGNWTWDIAPLNVGTQPFFFLFPETGGAFTYLTDIKQWVFYGGTINQAIQSTVVGINLLNSKTSSALPHSLLPDANSATKSCIAAPGPPSRLRQGQVLINNSIIVFGGERDDPQATADLYRFNVDSYVWTKSVLLVSPPNRIGASNNMASGWLWTFGGRLSWPVGTTNFLSHMYVLDASTLSSLCSWINRTDQQRSDTPWDPTNSFTPESIGAQLIDGFLFPLPRGYATTVHSAPDDIIMFGGTVLTETGFRSNDMWRFHMPTLTWSLLYPANFSLPSIPISSNKRQPSPFNQPTGRIHNIMQVNDRDPSQILIGFGIDQRLTLYCDLWIFDLNTNRFATQITIELGTEVVNIPSVRYGAISGMIDGRLLIIGGSTGVSLVTDVYELDVAKLRWVRLDLPSDLKLAGQGPAQRVFGVGTVIPQTRVLFLMGGSNTRAALTDPHFLSLDLVNVAGDGVSPPELQFSSDVLTLFSFSPTAVVPGAKVPTFTWATLGAAVTYAQYQDPVTGSDPTGFIRYIIQTTASIETGVALGLPITQPMLITSPSGDDTNRVHIQCIIQCFLIESQVGVTQVIQLVGLQLENGGFGRFVGPWAPDSQNGGAAIVKGDNTRVLFQDCVFSGNQAIGEDSFGGALAIERSTVTMLRCVFESNVAQALGGGVHAIAARLIITDCTFRKNIAGVSDLIAQIETLEELDPYSQGGALAVITSQTVIQNCSFLGNVAGYGGAISAVNLLKQVVSTTLLSTVDFVTVRISRSQFKDNVAVQHGGAIYWSEMNDESPIAYADTSFFQNNRAVNGSGGAHYLSNSYIRSSRSTYLNNSASVAARWFSADDSLGNGGGGAIFYAPTLTDTSDYAVVARPPRPENCIYSNNSASYGEFIASIPFDLQILDGRAFDLTQVSGGVIEPPILVGLMDYYGQLILTDSTTFVTISGGGALGGETIVKVQNGIANFTSVSFRLAPRSQVLVTFSASVPLPKLNNSITFGVMTSRDCQPGQALEFYTKITCRQCYAGGYQDQYGRTTCNQCPAGKFQERSSGTNCDNCAIGRYAEGKGTSTLCPLCPQNTFTHGEGATSCYQCEVGLKCENGAAAAKAGYWMIPHAVPAAPTNTTDNNTTTDSVDIQKVHPRRQVRQVHVAQMFALSSDVYEETVPCPYLNCLEGGVCGTNRKNPAWSNPLCGQCEDGYVEINHVCVHCEKTNGGLAFLVILVACIFVALLHRLSRTSAGASQIFFYFIQVVIFMSGSLGVWLDWLQIFSLRPSAVTGVTCIFPLNPYESMGLELTTPMILTGILFVYFLINLALSTDKSRQLLGKYEFAQRLNRWWGDDPLTSTSSTDGGTASTMVSLAPGKNDSLMRGISVASDAELIVSSSISVNSVSNVSGAASASEIRSAQGPWFYCNPHSYVRTQVSIFLFSYQNVTATILQHLVCIKAGDSTVVFADPAMFCDAPEYRRYLGFLIFLLIGYSFALPIYLALRLYFHRDQIREWKRASAHVVMQLKKAKAKRDAAEVQRKLSPLEQAEKAETESRLRAASMGTMLVAPTTSFALRLGHLYESFRAECYYFQSVILFRRAIFVAFDVGLTYHPTYKLAAYIIWNSCNLLMHVLLEPYEDPFNNKMETVTLFVLVLISAVLQLGQNATAGANQQFNSYPTSVQVVVTMGIAFPCSILAWRILWQAVKPTYKFIKKRVTLARSRGGSRRTSRKNSFQESPRPNESNHHPSGSLSFPSEFSVPGVGTGSLTLPSSEMISPRSGSPQPSPLDVDKDRRARMGIVGRRPLRLDAGTTEHGDYHDRDRDPPGIELEEMKTASPEPEPPTPTEENAKKYQSNGNTDLQHDSESL